MATLILFPLEHLLPLAPINLDSDDTPTTEVGGIIQSMGRKKAAKRKAKAQADDPLVEVMTKDLSILGSTIMNDSDTFARYVAA